MNGFYDLSDLATTDVERLVRRALELRAGAPARRFPGRSLTLVFFSPSLRTQASMQRAAAKLGLELVQLQGGTGGVWGLETTDGAVMDADKAEHVREAAAVLGRFTDVIALRAFAQHRSLAEDQADGLVRGFLRHAGVPVVNLESALWHPCQALADWATLDMLRVPRRAKFVLTWAWHPRALPHAVPNSTVSFAAQRGMDVVVLRPEGYDLDAGVMERARELSDAAGGHLSVTDDRDAALAGAQVVYAKSWGNLACWGDAPAETAARAQLRDWCVTNAWMERTDGARFLHCLPVRRNVVVADEVLDGPRSVVIDQAENRLHAQTALLEEVFATREASTDAPRSSVTPELEPIR